jgi:PEP-CTERM motif
MFSSLRLWPTLAAGVLLASAAPVSAAIVDPAGDFLATYTGPPDGDIDILSGDIAFDGTSFFLTATMAAAIDATPGQLYAWAINRGTGTPRIDLLRDPDIAPGVLLDAVVVMLPGGGLTVVNIPLVGPPVATFFPGGATVLGDTISATVALSSLPSAGFLPGDYTFSFASRMRVDPAVDGTNNEIADFLTGSGSLKPRAVPEPGTWLTMLLGFGIMGGVLRNKRRLEANNLMMRVLPKYR